MGRSRSFVTLGHEKLLRMDTSLRARNNAIDDARAPSDVFAALLCPPSSRDPMVVRSTHGPGGARSIPNGALLARGMARCDRILSRQYRQYRVPIDSLITIIASINPTQHHRLTARAVAQRAQVAGRSLRRPRAPPHTSDALIFPATVPAGFEGSMGSFWARVFYLVSSRRCASASRFCNATSESKPTHNKKSDL